MSRLAIQAFATSGLIVFLSTIFPVSAHAQPGVQLETTETGRVRKQILLTVRDASGNASPIIAHIYFIGKEPGAGVRFIYAHSDLSVNLRGSTEAIAKVDVPELKPKPTKHAPTGYVYTYTGVGDREGWILLAQTHGRALLARASSPALLDLAQGKSGDSLNAMVVAYEKRNVTPAPQRP